MNKKQILKEIKFNRGYFPRKAIETAIEMEEEIIPDLLDILKETSENIGEKAEIDNYFAPIYAMYLLAQFKEKKAFSLIMDLISGPSDDVDDLLASVITEDLCSMIASVYNGDIDSIKKVIENKDVNEYVRSAALRSMVILVVNDVLERKKVIEYFKKLYRDERFQDDYVLFDYLTSAACDLYPEELLDEIKNAFEKDLINDGYIDMYSVNRALEKSKDEVISTTKDSRSFRFIEDTIKSMEWWVCFNHDKADSNKTPINYLIDDDFEINMLFVEELKEKATESRIEYFLNITQEVLEGETPFAYLVSTRNLGELLKKCPEVKESPVYNKFLKRSPLKNSEFKYKVVYNKTGGVLNLFNLAVEKRDDLVLEELFKGNLSKKEVIKKWLDTPSQLWNELTPKLVWAGGGIIENALFNDFIRYFIDNLEGQTISLDEVSLNKARGILNIWKTKSNLICNKKTPFEAIIEEREKIYKRKKELIIENNIKSDFV